MLTTVTKEFTFDCAHMLEGHGGLCKNLHGHTYRLLVTAQSTEETLIAEGPSAGMVCDFKDLKSVVDDLVVSKYDHATVVNEQSKDPFEQALFGLLVMYDKKRVLFSDRPTAELMARWMYRELNSALKEMYAPYKIIKIQLYETPTSYAEVSRGEF